MKRTLTILATAAALGMIAGVAYSQPRPEALKAFDCTREVQLLAQYYDTMPATVDRRRSLWDALVAAYQAGDVRACHAKVIEVRKAWGLL